MLTFSLLALLGVSPLSWIAGRTGRINWVPPTLLGFGLLLGAFTGAWQLVQEAPLRLDLPAITPMGRPPPMTFP